MLSALILLKSNALDIYIKGETRSLTFSEDEIKHLEILNREKLDASLTNFLEGLKLQKAVLLLSNEVIFQKVLALDKENGIDEFFDKVPFTSEKIAKKQIKTKEQVFLFATNQELYKSIIETFISLGWSVDLVCPAALFPPIVDKTTLSVNEVEQILKSDDVLSKGNFIEDEEFVPEEKVQKISEKGSKKMLIIGTIIGILLAGFAFAAFQFRQNFINTQDSSKSQKVIEDALSSPTPVATQSGQIKKEDLKVSVLNGSGVSGLAAKIQGNLEDLGFKNIDIGNFEGTNISETIATFSGKIADKDKADIKTLLDKTFVSIVYNEATGEAKIDVAIVTGTKLK